MAADGVRPVDVSQVLMFHRRTPSKGLAQTAIFFLFRAPDDGLVRFNSAGSTLKNANCVAGTHLVASVRVFWSEVRVFWSESISATLSLQTVA
jgi:hypothetical protein